MLERMVLVVEDDRAVREALSALLEVEGYSVVAAANGEEALHHLQDGLRPSVILLDLMMPVMDGFEFRRRQLTDLRFSRIPVIVVSGVSYILADTDMRADAVIQKPVEPSELCAVVLGCVS